MIWTNKPSEIVSEWNPEISENIIHLDMCQIMYEYKSNCKKYK